MLRLALTLALALTVARAIAVAVARARLFLVRVRESVTCCLVFHCAPPSRNRWTRPCKWAAVATREASLPPQSERVAGIEPALQLWKSRLRPLQHTRASCTPPVSPLAVTVRTNDIAFRCFLEDFRTTCTTDHPSHCVVLIGWVSMVELHHVRREPDTAICTGHVSELLQ